VLFPNGYRRASIYHNRRRASAPNIQPIIQEIVQKPIHIEREAPSVKDLIRRFTIDDGGKPQLLRTLPNEIPNIVTTDTDVSTTKDVPTPRADEIATDQDEIELEEIKFIDDLLSTDEDKEPATPVADEQMTKFVGRPKPKRKHANFKKFDFKIDIKTDDEM
jgi:hypothetical protein